VNVAVGDDRVIAPVNPCNEVVVDGGRGGLLLTLLIQEFWRPADDILPTGIYYKCRCLSTLKSLSNI
jgi:hypothetical protein